MIAFDLFRALAGTDLGAWTGESGAGWTEAVGQWLMIGANRVYADSLAGGVAVAVNGASPPSANYDVASGFLRQSADACAVRVLGRYVDSDNYYAAEYSHNGSSATLRLLKRVSGTETVLDSVAIADVDLAFHLSLRMDGSGLVVKYAGFAFVQEELSASDSSLTATGKGALWTNISGSAAGFHPYLFVEALPGQPRIRDINSLSAGAGGVSYPMPIHAPGDILILPIETSNPDAPAEPADWDPVPNSGSFAGTSGQASSVGAHGFWRRAVTEVPSPLVVPDVGDHQTGFVFAVSDAVASGDPFDAAAVASTSGTGTKTFPGATTTADAALVLVLLAVSRNVTAFNAETSNWSNLDLLGLAEFFDATSTAGQGGGWGCAVGTKVSAGTFGDTTVDTTDGGFKIALVLAVKPEPVAGGGVTVTPGAAALVLAATAPAVAVSDHVTAEPGAAVLVLTGNAPTVATPVVVTPGTAQAVLAATAPTVTASAHVTATPGPASLVLTATAPAVATPVTVTPGPAQLTLTGHAPTVGASVVVTPGTASLVVTTAPPSVAVTDHRIVTPGPASVVLVGLAPTVGVTVSATPGPGALVLTATAPNVEATAGLTVRPGPAVLSVSGNAPTVGTTAHVAVTPAPAAIALAAPAPTVTATAHRTVTPGPATLTLTGNAPTVTAGAGRVVTPGPAALVATGNAPTVTTTAHVVAAPGVAALTVTGPAPGVTVTGHIVVVPGVAGVLLAGFAPTVGGAVARGVAGLTAERDTVDTLTGERAGGGLTAERDLGDTMAGEA